MRGFSGSGVSGLGLMAEVPRPRVKGEGLLKIFGWL